MKRLARLVVLVLVILGSGILVGIPVYIHPKQDPLQKSDAVFVLGGTEYKARNSEGQLRDSLGVQLIREGWAPTLVISGGHFDPQLWTDKPCDRAEIDPKPLCFSPDPPNTLGEARELRRLADEHGWKRVIVVTFRPHIARARFIVEHCFGGQLIMVASPAELSTRRWIFEYLYQTAGFVKAFLGRGC